MSNSLMTLKNKEYIFVLCLIKNQKNEKSFIISCNLLYGNGSNGIWSNDTIICGDLVIKNNATLTLSGSISMQASHRIYIKNGATLVINGGKTSLAGITVENGGTLILNGNGTIEIFNPADVMINNGGLFYHNYGKINVVNPFMSN